MVRVRTRVNPAASQLSVAKTRRVAISRFGELSSVYVLTSRELDLPAFGTFIIQRYLFIAEISPESKLIVYKCIPTV